MSPTWRRSESAIRFTSRRLKSLSARAGAACRSCNGRWGIGYGRSARLIDFMAEDGIVGAYNGAQAREVLFTMEQWESAKSGGRDALANAEMLTSMQFRTCRRS